MNKTHLILLLTLSVFLVGNQGICQKSVLNETEFRDKIYACWLGKNIGGTLGMPFEGKTDINNLSFYTNLKSDEPAPNDDLDLQILWLKAMEENNASVNAYTLGQYWLKYVPVNWNEYGIGKENMKSGIMPPLSGEFNNKKWKTSNGAWIRSEIWACLAPGNPMLAAEFAWEDACVDHGVAEGTIAEIFTASLESAAFIEHDRDRLIEFALSMIPSKSKTAIAVRTAVVAKKEGKDWITARDEVIKVTEDLGWFQAPRNVAFAMIGWLWGDGDFGKSICIAVNCGDDTDCTGATLGSVLGIIGGTKAIPAKWSEPIGQKIVTVAISGFEAPADIDVLTSKTLDMAKKMMSVYNMPVIISSGKTEIKNAAGLLLVDKNQLTELLNRNPMIVVVREQNLEVRIDYIDDINISDNSVRPLKISIKNTGSQSRKINAGIEGLPEGIELKGFPSAAFKLSANDSRVLDLSIMIKNARPGINRFDLNISTGNSKLNVPLVLVR
jgi:ADP-ribosylglycohydrolase